MNILQAILLGSALYAAYRWGYKWGFDDCDFSHDFDRCPHCNEYLDPEDKPEDT